MKNSFLSILIILVSFSCSKIENDLPLYEVKYSFLVAGHVYGIPDPNPLANEFGLYPPFKEQFDYIQEFPNMYHAIFTGDVVRNGSNQAQWDSALSDINQLDIDYHIAAGNHDRGEVFLDNFGLYYYSFMEGNDLFVILNTHQWNIEGDQKEFLINTLEEADSAQNIFLFCHELIWWSPDSIFQNIGINALMHYPGSSNFWSEINPILSSIDSQVYLFSGDLGATYASSPYAYYNYGNIHLVASGMGRTIDSNYLIVDVFKNGAVKLKLKATSGDPNRLGDITDYELP